MRKEKQVRKEEMEGGRREGVISDSDNILLGMRVRARGIDVEAGVRHPAIAVGTEKWLDREGEKHPFRARQQRNEKRAMRDRGPDAGKVGQAANKEKGRKWGRNSRVGWYVPEFRC